MTITWFAISFAEPAVAQQGAAAPNSNALPPGIQPGRVPLDEMNKENELITPEEFDKWKREKSGKYVEALKAKTIDANVIKVLDEGARIRVGRLTLKSNRNNMKKVRAEVYGEIHTFAVAPSKAREPALKAVVREAKKTLDGNFQVRLHALWMLSELEQTPAVVGRAPAVPFVETLPVFLEVIADVKQPEAVRITAAICAEKILKEGQLPTNAPAKDRTEAARGLIAALKNQLGTSGSYQKALLTALGQVGMATIADASGAQKPDVQLTLASVIEDAKRPTAARAKAVAVLGKYPLPAGGAGLNIAAISKATQSLVLQIGTDINAKRINSNVGYFQIQDAYVGLHALKNALPADKSVASAYSPVLAVVKSLLSQIQLNQAAVVPQKLLDDLK